MTTLSAAGNDFPAFVGGVFVGLFGAIFLFAYVAGHNRRRRAQAPKLAGNSVLELGEGLDLSKQYDITCSGEWSTSLIEHFEDVRILGYVGSDYDATVSKMYMHGRWLVIEFPDGRRGYLLPRSIKSLRER